MQWINRVVSFIYHGQVKILKRNASRSLITYAGLFCSILSEEIFNDRTFTRHSGSVATRYKNFYDGTCMNALTSSENELGDLQKQATFFFF